MLEFDGAFQTPAVHVDQRECCLAVSVEALEDFLEKQLTLFDELADVILVDEQVPREKRIGQAPRCFWDEAPMPRYIPIRTMSPRARFSKRVSSRMKWSPATVLATA